MITEIQSRWMPHISMYENRAAIKFSEKDFERAIYEFWDSKSKLYRMPRVHLNKQTLLVPSEALSDLANYNYSFDFESQKARQTKNRRDIVIDGFLCGGQDE